MTKNIVMSKNTNIKIPPSFTCEIFPSFLALDSLFPAAQVGKEMSLTALLRDLFLGGSGECEFVSHTKTIFVYKDGELFEGEDRNMHDKASH